MNILAADYPTMSESFINWINTASNEEIAGEYCDAYKEGNGIKARWMLGAVQTKAQWADDFVALGHDIEASIAADEARDAAFLARVASLGLADWAAANGIRTEYDLMEHNDRQYWAEREAA